MYLGIVPEYKVDMPWRIGYYGYAVYDTGSFWYPPYDSSKPIGASGFGAGDTVTVKVDLDAHKISFRKNGADNGDSQNIARGTYFFAFFSNFNGDAVTIIKCT